jgi:hypothetical protein
VALSGCSRPACSALIKLAWDKRGKHHQDESLPMLRIPGEQLREAPQRSGKARVSSRTIGAIYENAHFRADQLWRWSGAGVKHTLQH